MKIGILTLPLHTNYGGILQAFALQKTLERMGNDVTVLTKERFPVISDKLILLKYAYRVIRKYFFRQDMEVFFERNTRKRYKILSKNTSQFIEKNINAYYVQELNTLDNRTLNFDAIIVGSDQIWRPLYIKNTLYEQVPNAFLAFAKDWDIKRVSYAASFGTDVWEYSEEQTKGVRKLALLFDALSVREESAIKLCNDYLGVKAEHVLDPTMLLSRTVYEDLAKEIHIPEAQDGILMNYVLDSSNEIDAFINKVSKEKGLKPYRLDVSDIADGKMIQPSVEQWIAAIRDSKFVITDSFHACVYSIIFNRPFIAIGNKGRGYERFESLMNMCGLRENLLSSIKEYDSTFQYTIPNTTYEILNIKSEESFNFLKRSLSK